MNRRGFLGFLGKVGITVPLAAGGLVAAKLGVAKADPAVLPEKDPAYTVYMGNIEPSPRWDDPPGPVIHGDYDLSEGIALSHNKTLTQAHFAVK